MIFVDSSFWIAVSMPHDSRHGEARALLARHARQDLVTSNHVRGETGTFLNRKLGHWAAADFLDCLGKTRYFRVLFVGEELEREALRWLRRHDEREYSFVDATSFALMRSLRMRRALAFDGDFEAAGFTELRVGR